MRTNKVVLAYSGRLDTSIILDVAEGATVRGVTPITADLGQGDGARARRRKAEPARRGVHLRRRPPGGVRPRLHLSDAGERDLRGRVPGSCTSIAGPLIAKRRRDRLDETGGGRDRPRGDRTRATTRSGSSSGPALHPGVRIIAPWREWDLGSRESLLELRRGHGIPIERQGGNQSPYSMDNEPHAHLLRGDRARGPLGGARRRDVADDPLAGGRSRRERPGAPVTFERGDVVAVAGEAMTPGQVMATLNRIGGERGVDGASTSPRTGYVGMKVRCYETPGGTLLLRAHRAIESLTLDPARWPTSRTSDAAVREPHLNGYWWSPNGPPSRPSSTRRSAP